MYRTKGTRHACCLVCGLYGGGGDCRRGGLTSSAPYHRTRRVESSADVKLNSLTLKPLYYGKGVSVAPAAGSGSESDGAR